MSSDHYFAERPASDTSPSVHEVKVRGLHLRLASDRGVFSHGELDWGTRVLLENSDPPEGDHLLDLGCGGGAIALVLSKLRPDATIWAVDVNERARAVTRRTMDLNGVTNVRVVEPENIPVDVEFDAIWSNPPIRIGKDALHQLLLSWLSRLAQAGVANLVVHKNLGSDSLAKWLVAQGYEVERHASKQGYRVLRITIRKDPHAVRD